MWEVLKKLKEQTPTAQLIPSSYTQLFLAPYMGNALALDNYYLGIKYKTLVFAGDTFEDLADLISTAMSIYSYKWDKMYKTFYAKNIFVFFSIHYTNNCNDSNLCI